MNSTSSDIRGIRICDASALVDGGAAVLFDAPAVGGAMPAFAVRWHGTVHAYVNRCPHAGARLDWKGQVLEKSGRWLMCPTHGAIFEPDSGACAGGPCRGSSLTALGVVERDGGVWLGDA